MPERVRPAKGLRQSLRMTRVLSPIQAAPTFIAGIATTHKGSRNDGVDIIVIIISRKTTLSGTHPSRYACDDIVGLRNVNSPRPLRRREFRRNNI